MWFMRGCEVKEEKDVVGWKLKIRMMKGGDVKEKGKVGVRVV